MKNLPAVYFVRFLGVFLIFLALWLIVGPLILKDLSWGWIFLVPSLSVMGLMLFTNGHYLLSTHEEGFP